MNNLHIYPSAFKYESRILKETKSLVDSGLFEKIFIAAVWEKGLKVYEKLDGKREVWRIPLKTSKLHPHLLPPQPPHLLSSPLGGEEGKERGRNEDGGFFWKVLKHLEWMTRIFLRYRRKSIKFINCHTLSSLPLGVLFKIFAKSKLIYDAHELETEKEGWVGLRRVIAKILERILIAYADSVIVVSDSIRKWYKNEYHLKEVHLIRNVPYRETRISRDSNVLLSGISKFPPTYLLPPRGEDGGERYNLKERFKIENDEILFIYQGVLGSGRGIKILLNAFSKIEEKKHIVFMGYGVLEDMVKEYENNFSNIHFQPAVKPEEVINYTKSADVGIHLLENTCLNHYYSLPNKVFEYIFSGLPLIVSNFPDMGKLIDDYQCGWKVSVDEKSVVDLIEHISKEDIKEKKNNAINCRNNFGWQEEEKKLLKLYGQY